MNNTSATYSTHNLEISNWEYNILYLLHWNSRFDCQFEGKMQVSEAFFRKRNWIFEFEIIIFFNEFLFCHSLPNYLLFNALLIFKIWTLVRHLRPKKIFKKPYLIHEIIFKFWLIMLREAARKNRFLGILLKSLSTFRQNYWHYQENI